MLGREPLDNEMIEDVKFLRDNEVTIESREQALYKLQFDTSFVEGDSSYNPFIFIDYMI